MTFVYGGQRQSVAFQSLQCRSVGREVEKSGGSVECGARATGSSTLQRNVSKFTRSHYVDFA